MNSSKKNDKSHSDNNTYKDVEPSDNIAYDPTLDQWDEWYDEGEIQNKNSKIRRSKKRLYKQRDEW